MLNRDDLGGMLTTSENLIGVLHDKSSIVKGVLNQNENLRGIIDEENTLNGSLVISNSLSGLLGAPLGEYTTDYNDLDNKPQINGVTLQGNKSTSDLGLFSGDYNDLTNKPTIPAAQVNSDWNAVSGVAEILNKPSLSTVATSGDYDDLSNKPTIPAAQVNSDWDAVAGIAKILNKPSLSPVATSGDYDDLVNKPTIPAAQVNSDWNAVSGVAEILNKPTIPDELNDLSDVDITSPTMGETLYYNGSKWANGVSDSFIHYNSIEERIGTWLVDGLPTKPVYQKYIKFNSTITLQPNTNTNLASLPGDILLLGGGCIRIDSTYTGYFPYIQLVANGTYLQGNNIRSTSVGVNAVLIQYVYRS